MPFTATIRDGVLLVVGEGSENPDSLDFISLYDDPPEVRDDSSPREDVPIDSDGTTVRTIDVRGVEGVGVSAGINAIEARVFGSAQADDVAVQRGGKVFGNGGDDVLTVIGRSAYLAGGSGDDTLRGDGGQDFLVGGLDDDSLIGGSGGDTLTGGDGDDTIDGGSGLDYAVYSGAQDDYSIAIENGVYVVRDLRAGAPDGVDTLANVEFLVFF